MNQSSFSLTTYVECGIMTKYLLKRLLHGLISICIVVAIVMVMIYSWSNRDLIFAKDSVYSHQSNNQKEVYKYRKWEDYGYIDYVPFADYMYELCENGEIDEETRLNAVNIGQTEDADSELTAAYVEKFTEYYESEGYTVIRLNAVTLSKRKLASGGQQQLFAYKDKPLITRVLSYFGNLISVDNIHYVQEDIGKREIIFTLHDPAYGGEKFAPAIMGNGTMHKYLLYFDSQFPYIHQNLVSINLGKSYTVNQGVDVFTTMTASQGSFVNSTVIYPSGDVEQSADNIHTATYSAGSRESSLIYETRYTDDYTNVLTVNSGMSKMGYSFVIGILSVIIAYLFAVPLGILMARKKDKLVDKLGTVYIVFILAVPSLAYIFLFKAVGGAIGLPTTFKMDSTSKLMYFLPIISLALPSIGSLMKWLRRYIVDQMNSDYVKFARSGGLSEGEIFSKHILKNAIIPIVHGIPADILYALTGSIITERVYVVPGAGNLLTTAINMYDNSVIVGMTLFFATLSVVSIILGDILMSLVDPRISFTSKAR